MNLKTIGEIPYKEKRLLVAEACLMYKRIQAQKRKLYSGDNKLSDIEKALNINNLKTLSLFDTVIELLDSQEAEVIKNDFIDEKPQSWYIDSWSKATYYKIKHKAVDSFLFLLYA